MPIGYQIYWSPPIIFYQTDVPDFIPDFGNRIKRDEFANDPNGVSNIRKPLLFKRETNVRKPLLFKRDADENELFNKEHYRIKID